jgi:hypothetical protein
MSTDNSGGIVSDLFQADAPAVVIGGCPLCAAPVLWAFSGRESPDRVLLVPDSGVRLSVEPGRTVVVASTLGRLQLAAPWVFWLHVCDPRVVTSSIGSYTPDVLIHTCPIDSCLSPPGELCVTSRYEVLPRPHGARVALAASRPWSDGELIGPADQDPDEV